MNKEGHNVAWMLISHGSTVVGCVHFDTVRALFPRLSHVAEHVAQWHVKSGGKTIKGVSHVGLMRYKAAVAIS